MRAREDPWTQDVGSGNEVYSLETEVYLEIAELEGRDNRYAADSTMVIVNQGILKI